MMKTSLWLTTLYLTPTTTSRKNSAVSSKPLAEVKDDGNSSTPVNCVKSKDLGSLGSDNGKRKYGNSPLPDPLPFPSNFSVVVQEAMDNGNVLPVRRHLVNDIGSFYFGLTSHPQQGDYKWIALLICKKFPELRDSTPSSYWVSFSYFYCIHRSLLSFKVAGCKYTNVTRKNVLAV